MYIIWLSITQFFIIAAFREEFAWVWEVFLKFHEQFSAQQEAKQEDIFFFSSYLNTQVASRLLEQGWMTQI